MSLKNYQPVKLQYGLNRVVYGNTNVEVPDDIKLYHMKYVGTLTEIKDKSLSREVVDIDGVKLGDVREVQLYYDAQGKMTIPEKQTLVELGRKGPGGTKTKKTVQLPTDILKKIAGFRTKKGTIIPGYGGNRKRATTMRKRKSNKITRRRCNNKF
jgi:sporulation protein YlmC with PRC-barrel domain